MPPDALVDVPTVYYINDLRVRHYLENLDSITQDKIYSAFYRLQLDPHPLGCERVPGSPRVSFVVKETWPRYKLTYEVNDDQGTILVESIEPTAMPDRQESASDNRKSPLGAGLSSLVAVVVLMVTLACIYNKVGLSGISVVIFGAMLLFGFIAPFVSFQQGKLSSAELRAFWFDRVSDYFKFFKGKKPL